MAFVQADLDALDAALKTGILTVQYGDTRTTYRTLEEMRRVRADIVKDINDTAGVTRLRQHRIYARRGY